MLQTFDDSTTAFQTPLNALIDINDHLKRSDTTTWRGKDYVQRAVNFMVYELSSRTNELDDAQTFEILNDYFFGTKGFRIHDQPLLLDDILQEKQGAPIVLALLYIHIGMCLGLKLQLVNWPLHGVVRWEHENRAKYVDLNQKGKVLSDDEMVEVINRHRDQARVLALTEAAVQYLAYISMRFRQNENLLGVIAALDLVLKFEPNNMRFLLERALAKKEAGQIKDAVLDFKRYFSFVDMNEVAPELRAQYEALIEC